MKYKRCSVADQRALGSATLLWAIPLQLFECPLFFPPLWTLKFHFRVFPLTFTLFCTFPSCLSPQGDQCGLGARGWTPALQVKPPPPPDASAPLANLCGWFCTNLFCMPKILFFFSFSSGHCSPYPLYPLLFMSFAFVFNSFSRPLGHRRWPRNLASAFV
jgi:hypothetical protein